MSRNSRQEVVTPWCTLVDLTVIADIYQLLVLNLNHMAKLLYLNIQEGGQVRQYYLKVCIVLLYHFSPFSTFPKSVGACKIYCKKAFKNKIPLLLFRSSFGKAVRFTVLLTTKNSGLLESMEDGAVSPEESPGVPRIFSRKDPIKSFRKKKK